MKRCREYTDTVDPYVDHRITKQSIIGAAVDKQVVTALTAMVQNGIPVTNNVIDQQIHHIREVQAPHLHNTRATPYTNAGDSKIYRLNRIYSTTTSCGQYINKQCPQ